MWNVVKGTKEKIKEMNQFWNEVVEAEGFYKPISEEEYLPKLESINGFSFDGVGLVYDEGKLIGMGIGVLKGDVSKDPNAPGAINAILVKPSYRHKRVGETILHYLEDYFRQNNRKYSVAYGYLPSCYGWYIPNTDKHDHPCAPGIRVNSNEYFFLLHHRYEASGFQDAFHLNLSDYEISDKIAEILKKNEEKSENTSTDFELTVDENENLE